MALSEDEKQILAEMERQFVDSGPVANMPETNRDQGKSITFSPKRLAYGVLVGLVGIALLLAGVMQGYTLLGIVTGVLGFIVLFIGVIIPLHPSDSKNKKAKQIKRYRQNAPKSDSPEHSPHNSR